MKDAQKKALASEILLAEDAGYLEAEGMEKTFKFQQEDIKKHVDVQTANKLFSLNLAFGPYHIDYTKNGRFMVIAGMKGHVASFDCKTGKLRFEMHLKEKINSVKWLHNENMFAVAQKKHVYIYDGKGIELHKLSKHSQVKALEFLPYHFLLVSIGVDGVLRYQDTSTGMLVAELPTRLGPCEVMTHNPQNAVILLGHSNGTVTMWSPSLSTPLVKIFCHNGPITALSVHPTGRFFVSSGLDGQMKIWDLSNFKNVSSYFTISPAKSLSVSQKGLIAVGHGPHVTIWKDAFVEKQKSPYMYHLVPSENMLNVQFCPFEDILGASYGSGLCTLLIPGSGEPNYDALENNPYQNTRQRQESEVRGLLDKIQPDTIALENDFIGTVVRNEKERAERKNALQSDANGREDSAEMREKRRMRGRNSVKKRYLRKRQNVIGLRDEEKKEVIEIRRLNNSQEPEEKNPLQRFRKSKGI